jgi:hypothetical protein
MRGDVDDLHVVRDDEPFEPLANPLAESRLEVEQEFLRQAVDVQVALQFSLGGDERGVTALSGPQSSYVIRYLPMEESGAIRARYAQAPAEAQVRHARSVAQSAVFPQRVSKVFHDLDAVHLSEMGAEVFVKLVQRQWSHRASVAA